MLLRANCSLDWSIELMCWRCWEPGLSLQKNGYSRMGESKELWEEWELEVLMINYVYVWVYVHLCVYTCTHMLACPAPSAERAKQQTPYSNEHTQHPSALQEAVHLQKRTDSRTGPEEVLEGLGTPCWLRCNGCTIKWSKYIGASLRRPPKANMGWFEHKMDLLQ